MRALYGNPNVATPDTGTPQPRDRPGRAPGGARTDSRSDTLRSADHHQDTSTGRRHNDTRHPAAAERPAEPPADSRKPSPRFAHDTDRSVTAADDIDPRWLAGVPRPAGALPDDAGRAYLRWHRDRPEHDTRPCPDDRLDAKPPPPDHIRADRLHPHIDHPSFQDHFDDREPPDRYGTPLQRPDGTRVPCLIGKPERGQAEQGWLGDCGVVATLGAVAAHRPADIGDRIAEQPDGTYKVRLNEAQWSPDGAAPTGQMIELTVTPTLPVFDTSPDESAFAQPTEAAWAPVLEKAIAGVDQTWTPSRREQWAQSWRYLCESDDRHTVKNPRTGPPPHGYTRLNQGSTSWDRAELLTQITGRESIVRQSPDEAGQLAAVFARQLRDRKPILAASRSRVHDGERLPHNLEPAHAYEVVAVACDKVTLRNPWNRKQPEPMTPTEYIANMERDYTTLR